MRYGFSLWLALTLIGGCSDSEATGGSGGDGGQGGVGGNPVACTDFVCPCTEAGIRAAITEGDGPFTFDCFGPTTVRTDAAILIDNDVILDGGGNLWVENWTEDHGDVFRIAEGVTAELRGVLVSGADGSIHNSGTLTLTDSTVPGNGPIINDGAATVMNSTVSATLGIWNGATLKVTNSTVSLLWSCRGSAAIANSTLAGLENSDGKGCDGGLVTIRNSVLDTANSPVGGCAMPLISNGYNIESPGDSCGLDQPTDLVNVSAGDLKLGRLQDNGGATLTHALGEGSVAINWIPAEHCVDTDGAPLTTDQRGEPRPAGDGCDVGAFEVQCNQDLRCDDFNDCTIDACDAALSECKQSSAMDETPCAGGTCEAGRCALSGTVLPCTEQGIRNAIATGGGPYTFDCDGPTTIGPEPAILIDNDVELDGASNITLENSGVVQSLFRVTNGTEAVLRGFALRGGGPIENEGSLQLVNVKMSGVGNPKILGSIRSSGQLTVIDSEFVESWAASSSDILVSDGELTLQTSTVEGVYTFGRALILDSLVARRLTVSIEGNAASGEADVVNSTLGRVTNYGGTVSIVNSTMTPGRTWVDRVAIEGDGQTSVRGSVVVGACAFAVVSDGYNVQSSGDACGFDRETDQVNVSAGDLNLGELADNGGPTMTHALLPGSVAIDAIAAEDCVDADGEPLTSDQRGFTRPVGGGCDVGAFEVQD
jgi:hypothetical protein